MKITVIVSMHNSKQFCTSSQYEDELDGGRRKKGKKKGDVNIYDIYEPFDLEKGHFTLQDHEIKMTDLPERLLD